MLTDALDGYEDLKVKTLRWLEVSPSPREKRRLVMRVADFARRFHAAGLVHRDFYLCHLLEHEDPSRDLGVLDLHRALIFDEIPQAWRRRDLAALLYSALDLPVGSAVLAALRPCLHGAAAQGRVPGRRWHSGGTCIGGARRLYRKGDT